MGAHQTIDVSSPANGLSFDEPHPLTHPSRVTVSGFVAGTLIDTPEGLRRVEDLRPGDMVTTLDNGAQRLDWTGAWALQAPGDMGAIVMAPGAVGNLRELRVSPGMHLVLPRGPVRAATLLSDGIVRQECAAPLTYVALQFQSGRLLSVAGGALVHIAAPSVLCLLDRAADRPARMVLI